MRNLIVLFTILAVIVTLTVADRPVDRNKLPYKVVCYWGTWAYYRDGPDGKFEAEKINPHICTHINYGFAKLTGNRIELFDPDLDDGDEDWNSGLKWGHGMIRRMNELRKYNPNLVNMISIGGWNEGSDKYSVMARSEASRQEFVQSVLEFLKKYDLDGLDVDWEYPSMAASGGSDRTTGRDADKQDYISLLRELRAAFEPHGYVLSAAVSAGIPTMNRAYDIPEVSKYLHFINLMTYDFHGAWESKTGHNAPLYPLQGSTGIEHDFTTSVAVDEWIKKGADAKKLVLGIPLYGRTFTLAGSENGIGAPVIGNGGNAGPITRLFGMLGYNEICAMVKQGWNVHWNDTQKIPYATVANQWIGYDNEQSVKEKLSFLHSRQLGGAMVWTVDTDDFSGHCGEGKYPLLKIISRDLNKVDGPDETIPHTHYKTTLNPNHETTKKTDPNKHTTATEPTTVKPTTIKHQDHTDPTKPTQKPGSFKCTKSGFFIDPNDRHKFHQCVNFAGVLKDYLFSCALGAKFDEKLHICVHDS